MSLTLEDIQALRKGERDPINAGELPYEVGLRLQLRNPNVYLSADSLGHINREHPDVSDFDLLLLPLAVRRGLLVHEVHKPRYIIANYRDSVSNLRYVASLKIANEECEVWVSSFYRCRRRQTKAHLGRGVILKMHDK